MNFWPTSKWQSSLADKAARTGVDDERISEVPVVFLRRGEGRVVRLLPPRFATDRYLMFTVVEHVWPPIEHNLLYVRALCPMRTDPEVFGKEKTAPTCPAFKVGIEVRASALVYAIPLDGQRGAMMLKIPEWEVLRELVDLGAFDFESLFAVKLWRDERGFWGYSRQHPCEVAEERFVLETYDLRLAKRTPRPDILDDMAAALAGWLKAGQPQPPPDRHRDLMEHLPGCTLVPIPFGFKGPHLPGWTHISLEETRDYDYRIKLNDGNIGLRCGKNEAGITIGLDADEDSLRSGLLRCNPKLHETFAVEGRPGRAKWFFQAAGPAAEKCLNSTKILRRSTIGKDFECGDWLATGKQGVIWGLHPDGMWYRPNWKPLISIDVREFVLPPRYYMKVREETRLESAQEQYRRARFGQRPPANAQRIESALSYIDPDERGTWFKVGCALKRWGAEIGNDRAAKAIFDRWSAQSRKYDVGGQDKLWNSIGGNGGRAITLGSLFFIAQENGWEVEDESEE